MKPPRNSLSSFSCLKTVGICILLGLVKHGLAQRYSTYHSNPYHQFQNVWGGNPHKQYQFLPSVPSPGGLGFPSGGRIVDAVKAQSLHYSNIVGGSPHSPFASASNYYQSSPAASPYYSGYYNAGDKYNSPPTKVRQPSHYVSSTMYSAPSYFSSSPPTRTPFASSSSSPPALYRRPVAASSPYHYHHLPTSGPVASASMETYREALDLFSEVVGKLDHENGGSYGSYPSPHYTQSSPATNAIYGSSGSFNPHHLDHIMGPDFLNRAHKLYSKIIKEQNNGRQPPGAPSYYTSSANRGYPMNGLSYYESAISPSSRPTSGSTSSYTYTHPSPYNRNMILGRITPDSALERSLIDTVTTLEMNLDKQNGKGEPSNDMETSESRMVPFTQQQSNQAFVGNSFSTASPPIVPEFPIEDMVPSEEPSNLQASPASPVPIPLNENDFIEHPLPYNEYEELVKDIALNH